jgi:hypothetical protein
LPGHFHVGAVGPFHGHADGDALSFDQQAALDALLGAVGGVFARLFPPRAAPWSCSRPCSARTSRSPSTRRRPPGLPPTSPGKHPRAPSAGSGRGRWTRGRSGWRPGPSTGSRCGARRGWPPCRCGRGWGACRRRRGGCSPARGSIRRWPPTGHQEYSTGPEQTAEPWLFLAGSQLQRKQMQLHSGVIA